MTLLEMLLLLLIDTGTHLIVVYDTLFVLARTIEQICLPRDDTICSVGHAFWWWW